MFCSALSLVHFASCCYEGCCRAQSSWVSRLSFDYFLAPGSQVRYILAAADSAGKSRGRALSIEEQLQECAVTCLQSVWRGHAVRKSLQQNPSPAREPSASVDLASSGKTTVFTGRSFQQIDATGTTGGARACHPDVGDGTWAHSLKNFGDASSPRPVLSSSPAKGRKATEVMVYANVIVRGGNVPPPHAGEPDLAYLA
jgi:hypothetical protein